MLSTQRLWPKLWSSCVAFIFHLSFSSSIRLSPRRRVVPQDKGSLQRYGGPLVIRDEPRREVRGGTSSGNARAVRESVCRTDEKLAAIHGIARRRVTIFAF